MSEDIFAVFIMNKNIFPKIFVSLLDFSLSLIVVEKSEAISFFAPF